MGLDMNLNAKRYLFNSKDQDQQIANDVAKLFPELTDYAVAEITVEAGYWRKANAIHKWFVDNVQGGEDDCRPYFVHREQLIELKAACEQVIADPSMAGELLPTEDGFFFGSVEYDDWYVENLHITIANIDRALALPNDWTLEYRSSW